MPVKAGPDMFTISVNIGICTYPVHADTPEELLERVQVALRYAKRQDGMVTYNATRPSSCGCWKPGWGTGRWRSGISPSWTSARAGLRRPKPCSA